MISTGEILIKYGAGSKYVYELNDTELKDLQKYSLCATGTTAKLLSSIELEDNNHLKVEALYSGPLGGDQQIGAMIAERKIDMLIFFCDNLAVQGHQNDVSALTRLASLYNIPFATNKTTADMLLTSTLIDDDSYQPEQPSFSNYINREL